jgi:ABC-2 type transport system permease protein
MIATTASGLIPRRRPAVADGAKVTFGRVLHSEWLKFRTLRSSWLTLGSAIAAMIIIGLVIGYTTSTGDWAGLEAEDRLASSPVQGFRLTQLIIGVLGVLFVTGEYATGMIRSTFAAVPRRLSVIGAKTAVFGVVALVAMTLASFAAFYAAQIFLAPDGHGSSLSNPGALRAVAGVGVYLMLIGMLGGALGWIVRSTAGAISALVAILLIVPLLIGFLPGSVSDNILKFMPSNAGESFLTSARAPDALAPWTGIGVLALWVVVTLTAGVLTVRRRDA